MKNLKISQKLIVSFLVVIVLFAFVSLYQLYELKNLAKLQDEGAVRSHALVYAKESSAMGYKLYSVVADAIINRDLTNAQKEWNENVKDANEDFANLASVIDTDIEKDYLNQGKEHLDEFISVFEDEMMPLLKMDSSMDDISTIDAKLDQINNDLEGPLVKLVDSIDKENEEADKHFDETVVSVFNIAIIINILAVAIAVLFIIILVNLVAKPLIKGVNFAKEIADGNLLASLEIDQKDEVGILASSLQNMVEKLKDVIENVIAGANNIASASLEMSSTSQQMSQGANEQASAAEEVSSSMEEMVSNIQQNTDNAQSTEKIAIKATEGIKAGNESTRVSVEAMKQIAEKITIINDIAFQTNILALNAAVEAARAGEHGKGFAVVAAEVRKLAERSKVAADEIAHLSKSGVAISEKAGQQMQEIVPEIEKTAKLVQEIAAASIEQNSGADQVNNAIQQLNQVTQQNAAASEELATSSEELSSQAEQLKDLISYFRVDNRSRNQVQAVGTHKKATQNKPGAKTHIAHLQKNMKKGVDIKLDSYDSKDDEYEKF